MRHLQAFESTIFGLPIAAFMSNALLFMLISGMAGSCDARLLKRKFLSGDARGILAGLFCQYVVLPFLGYLSLSLFGLDETVAITLMLVTTSPGGGFSGVWCSLSNADLALSVAMTTASTLACTFFLPFNVYFYVQAMYPHTQVAISFPELFGGVCVVVSAVIFGATMSRLFPDPAFRQGMNTLGSVAGVCLMVLGGASNASSKDPLWENSIEWFFCIGTPCVLGLVSALGVAWFLGLESAARVAVAIECCYQNTGLALTIALTALPASQVGKAVGVPLFYGIVEMAIIPIFGLAAWKANMTYAKPDEPLWKALLHNYQPSAKIVEDDDSWPCDGLVCCGGCCKEDETSNPSAPSTATSSASGRTYLPINLNPTTSSGVEGCKDTPRSMPGAPPRNDVPQFMKVRSLKKASMLQENLATNAYAKQMGIATERSINGPEDRPLHRQPTGDLHLVYQRLHDDIAQWDPNEYDADLPSDRNYNKDKPDENKDREFEKPIYHKVSALEIACAEDKGALYAHDARKAEAARQMQQDCIKKLLIKGAPLPYELASKNFLFVLRENNVLCWQKNTKMKFQAQMSPRLVLAYADLTPQERDKIIERQFFTDPALTLYQYGCLIEITSDVERLHSMKREVRDSLDSMVVELQYKLVQMFAFIDCPLDENSDQAMDDTQRDRTLLIDKVLATRHGWLALKQMAHADCQLFLGDEALEPFFRRHYRGSLLTQLVESKLNSDGIEFSWRWHLCRGIFFLVTAVINAIFGFLVAPVLLCFTSRTLWFDSCSKRLYTGTHSERSTASTAFFDLGPMSKARRGDTAEDKQERNELKYGLQGCFAPALYLLEDPWMVALLRSLMELGQVLLLGSLRTIDPDNLPFWIRVNFLWAFAMLVFETSELMQLGSLYAKDRLNIAKMSGLVLTIIALGYEIALMSDITDKDADTNQTRNLMAMGVLLLWLQELRILYTFPSIGPLVFLVFEMFKDVLQWFIIQLFVVMSFGVAFFALYYDGNLEECGLGIDENMTWSKNFDLSDSDNKQEETQGLITALFDNLQFDTIARFHDASQGLFYLIPLLGVSMTGNDLIPCLRKSDHSLVGPSFMLVFLVSTVVLLTNMLIAMMNDRFSSAISSQRRLFRFNTAFRTIMSKYEKSWSPPSPFNLLFIGNAIFHFVIESFFDKHNSNKDEKREATLKCPGQLELARKWFESKREDAETEKGNAFQETLKAFEKMKSQVGDNVYIQMMSTMMASFKEMQATQAAAADPYSS